MFWSRKFLLLIFVVTPAFLVLFIPTYPDAFDTSLILSSDDSIKAPLETYDQYEKASGSKLNRGKSKGLWLGSWRGRTDSPVDLDWSSSKLKVLGVFIGIGDLIEDNWRPRINAVDKVLSSWRSRSLSFRGKALVINALALSRLVCGLSRLHAASHNARARLFSF